MKFPKLHHERVLEVIESNGLKIEDFYLVKRKGWIRIEHLHSGDFFNYFKKKETIIDPDSKQWVNNMFFKIKRSGEPDSIEPTFEMMIDQLDKWIRKLQ